MASPASRLLPRKPDAEDEALLKLFWNRAELKKEFRQLRLERDQLRDKLRQQEGATMRAQQRVEQLEALLADPLQAANAAVYYQLRGLWRHCRKRLAHLAEDLANQQEEAERRRIAEKFETSQAAAIAGIDERVAKARRQVEAFRAERRVIRNRLKRLKGFWNYFRRRATSAQKQPLQASLETVQLQLEVLLQTREKKHAEARPEFKGLSLEGTRVINLAVIAMAQELYLQFAAGDVSVLARETTVRSVTDVHYGRTPVCRELNNRIEKMLRRLEELDDLRERVLKRSRRLRRDAQYRQKSDTVPVAGSFTSIMHDTDGSADGDGGKSVRVNVLAEEYWDIYTVLLT